MPGSKIVLVWASKVKAAKKKVHSCEGNHWRIHRGFLDRLFRHGILLHLNECRGLLKSNSYYTSNTNCDSSIFFSNKRASSLSLSSADATIGKWWTASWSLGWLFYRGIHIIIMHTFVVHEEEKERRTKEDKSKDKGELSISGENIARSKYLKWICPPPFPVLTLIDCIFCRSFWLLFGESGDSHVK